MKYGVLIKSIMGGVGEKCLHVGMGDHALIASLHAEMRDMKICLTDTGDAEMFPWADLVGPLTGDIGSGYDLFIIPASEPSFSTSIYIAVEGALKNGGVLAIYGEKQFLRSRANLLVAMMKEGTISPFSVSGFDKEIITFILQDGILVREM